jgi:hypothetical protein
MFDNEQACRKPGVVRVVANRFLKKAETVKDYRVQQKAHRKTVGFVACM